MHARNIFDRREYETDADFEKVVDLATAQMPQEAKRDFVYSLMRDCRGCGTETTYQSVERVYVRAQAQWHVLCKCCGHSVPLTRDSETSLGRFVTLWNTTGLTIEANQ